MRGPARRLLRRLKNDVIYFLVLLLLGFLRRWPTRWAIALGPALGQLAWWLARRERALARRNLDQVFPTLTPGEKRRLARGVFLQLGRGAMECVMMHRLRSRIGGPRSPIVFAPGALETLQDAMAVGRGAIFFTAHLGNWELMAAAVAREVPVSVLYQPSYDPRFTRLLVRFRRENGIDGINVRQAGHLRQALAALRRGRVLGILGDQPVRGAPLLPFLGHPAPTSLLAGSLALRLKAPILVGFVQRSGPCQHAIFIRRIWPEQAQQSAAGVTRQLNQQITEAVLKAPEQWAWTMDRWRSASALHLSRPSANYIPAGTN